MAMDPGVAPVCNILEELIRMLTSAKTLPNNPQPEACQVHGHRKEFCKNHLAEEPSVDTLDSQTPSQR
jgi:hypothetical protein